MLDQASAGNGMHVLDGVVVAQAPDSIDDEALRRFKSGLLDRVHATSPRGVIIDVSRVRLLDSTSYALLADAGRMAAMLGARVVFVGFQPGVVSTLMDLNVDCSSLTTALSLEDGIELLRPALRPVLRLDQEDDLEEVSESASPNVSEDASGDAGTEDADSEAQLGQGGSAP